MDTNTSSHKTPRSGSRSGCPGSGALARADRQSCGQSGTVSCEGTGMAANEEPREKKERVGGNAMIADA